MGTSDILLRSKMKGLRLSNKVGSKLSINGDVLGFSYAGASRTDILGFEGVDAGQAIQSYGDYRKVAPTGGPLEERFLLLDGTIPTPMAATVAKALAAFAMLNPKLYDETQMARIKADFSSRIPGKEGALNHSMLYLACGHDSSGGEYRLAHAGERVYAKWPGMKTEEGFNLIEKVMAKHAELQGGVYIRNPRETVFGGKRLMGTHPLGGAPMGEDSDRGACDHRGRLYDGEGSVHRGLYVADGSMIPHSLGATPLITISALSERIAEKILEAGELV
jgi:cholesterol oxidase